VKAEVAEAAEVAEVAEAPGTAEAVRETEEAAQAPAPAAVSSGYKDGKLTRDELRALVRTGLSR
jgi:hypothetical protein